MLSRGTGFHYQNAAVPDCLFVSIYKRFAGALDTSFIFIEFTDLDIPVR